MHTTNGISASMASSIPAAASGGLHGISSFVSDIHRLYVRNEYGRCSRTSLLSAFADCTENGSIEMGFSSTFGVGSTDDVR